MKCWMATLWIVGCASTSLAAEPEAPQEPPLTAELRSILREHGNRSHEALARKLDPIAPEEQVRALMPLLDNEGDSRSWSTAVTYRLGELWEHSWQPVVAALDDPKPSRRFAAAGAIRAMQFKNQSKDDKPWAADAAPKLLRLMRDATETEDRNVAAYALASLDAQAGPVAGEVAEMLNDPDPNVVRAALSAMREIGPEGWRGIPRLIEIVNEPGELSRSAAVEALSNMGWAAREAAPALIAAAADPKDSETGYNVSYALWRIGAEGLTPQPGDLIARALPHAGGGIQMMVRELELRDPHIGAALAEVIGAATEHNGWEAELAVRTLKATGPHSDAVVRYLRAVSESARPFSRVWATVAVAQLTGETDPAVKRLQAILAQPGHKDESTSALEAASMLGPAARGFLGRISPNTNTDSAWEPINLVEAYYRIHGKADRYVDYLAGQMPHRTSNDAADSAGPVLALLGPLADEAAPKLIEVLGDYSDWAQYNRSHAADALAAIGPSPRTRPGIPTLVRMTDRESEPHVWTRYSATQALWSISRDADAVVAGYMGIIDERDRVTFFAMWKLRDMGPAARSAIPRLRRIAADDPNPHFRSAAQIAIDAITAEPGPADDATMSRWFDAMAGDDPREAVDGMWRFAEAGDAGRAYLLRRLNLDRTGPIDELVAQLSDENADVRRDAADRLARTLPDSFATLKQKMLEAESPMVKAKLFEILQQANIRGPVEPDTQAIPADLAFETLEENRRLALIRRAMTLQEESAGSEPSRAKSGAQRPVTRP